MKLKQKTKTRTKQALSGVELTLSKFEYMFLGSVYVSEYIILTGHQIIFEHKLLLKL